ncbi:MAG: hypothetical protein GWN58_42265 [Anaerolineae bacterium]|nr:hypothetical protein [Thermoplasmata archaeon]NIT77110.1 hypothetical protein [Thermoplasmata archaeon]NIV35842.1 hypothetical protein [Anaerolineae bacterium]NIY03481.1 hypothetical protein [Thermoplasmata archaeon]
MDQAYDNAYHAAIKAAAPIVLKALFGLKWKAIKAYFHSTRWESVLPRKSELGQLIDSLGGCGSYTLKTPKGFGLYLDVTTRDKAHFSLQLRPYQARDVGIQLDADPAQKRAALRRRLNKLLQSDRALDSVQLEELEKVRRELNATPTGR